MVGNSTNSTKRKTIDCIRVLEKKEKCVMKNKNDTSTSSEAFFAGCLFIFLFLFLFLISSLPSHSQQYNGTISQSGYTPPSNVWVQWCQMGDKPTCKSFQLNPSISWDGQSKEGKFGRYAGGDFSVQGFSSVPAVSSENKGGEIGAALLKLMGGQYAETELWDFAFANSCGQFVCGCQWYERITGSPHPIDPGCKNESTEPNSLRPCPNEPEGSGRNRNNPSYTADTDIPEDRAKQVPCWNGSKRVGRWLIRKGVREEPGPVEEPIKPIDPIVDKPIDKTIDKTADSALICLVIKIDPQTRAYTVEVCK